MKKYLLAIILGCLVLQSCTGLSAADKTPVLQTAAPPSQTPTFESTVIQPSPVSTAQPGIVTLKVWLPPQFDPAAGTPAAELFKARIDEFSKRRPGVRVEIRIKALSGVGGLLDSLTTASAAAPLAMPDLVILPREVMEAAALKGLLHPMDGLTEIMDEQDWYEYSRQLARVQNSIFGLPFAGDALILLYRPQDVAAPPASWSETLEMQTTLVFPAADPQALFTLALYKAKGGQVLDADGRPFLDADILSSVLSFYRDAEQTGVMPYWISQYLSDDQAWESFLDKRADLLVTWSSRYLEEQMSDVAVAPIPSPEGENFTLASGWVWALASPHIENHALSIELAEFFFSSSFMASWTEAFGLLPTRPSALDAWVNQDLREVLSTIISSANLYPATDILSSLGAPLSEATVQVLKRQSDPMIAAQSAVESLTSP